MPQLILNLLGSSDILLDGKPVKGMYAHAKALLIYLTVEARSSHSRDALVDLLWPDESPDVARHNLRQAIWSLRALGGRSSVIPFLVSDRHTITLQKSADLWCDVQAFTSVCKDADQYANSVLTAQFRCQLTHAIDLYRGEFLSGFSVPNSAGFEEWVASKRDYLHCRAIAVLEQSCTYFERSAQWEFATDMARRLVEIEPGEEKAQRRLMRLLAESGQGTAALAQYQACENYLRENLGVSPSAETKTVLEAIRVQIDAEPSIARTARRERRRVTVMHCGLVTPPEVDPENLQDWRNTLHARVQSVAKCFDASLQAADGLDVVLLFGYPQAVCGDIERAVQAALTLRAWANKEFGQIDGGMGLGIGIATGEVVLDEKNGEIPLVGEPVFTAARLRHHVLAGEILLADGTVAMLRGRYDCQRLSISERGAVRMAYRLHEGNHGQAQGTFVLPLIGREQELGILLNRWDRARAGGGHVVMISGESGIGKSYLLRALLDQIPEDIHTILQTRCLPAGETTELEPVLRLLRALSGLTVRQAKVAQRRKLDIALRRLDFDEKERSLLAAILDLGKESGSFTLVERQQAMGLILRLLRTVARQPLLLSIEDMHDMDPSSKEFLGWLLSEIDRLPILMIMTTRLASTVPWLNQHNVTHIALGPLLEEHAKHLAQVVADGRLDSELIDQIVNRSSRVPLFIEEMVKAVFEADASAEIGGALLAVPATLQDSLLVRFDRLREAGRLAKLAAVIGWEFDQRSLEFLAKTPANTLSAMLARLVDACIIAPMDERATSYTFCHDLVRQFAYDTLLRSERRELHAALAGHLVGRMAVGEPVAPEIIATHYRAAEMLEPAVQHYYLAGMRSSNRAASAECVANLREGMTVLAAMPPSLERDRMELQLRIPLGLPLLQGRESAAAVWEHFERVESLVGAVADTELLIPALRSLSIFHLTRADCSYARPLIERFVKINRQGSDAMAIADTYVLEGVLFLFEGRPKQAQPLLEQSVVLADAIPFEQVVRYGADPAAAGRVALALGWWARGYPGRTNVLIEEAVARGRRLAHPLSFVWTATVALCVLGLQGDEEAALALSAEAADLCTALGMDRWACRASMIRDRILAERTRDSRYLEQLLQSREWVNGPAAVMSQPYPEMLAAEGCLIFGDCERGLPLIEQAIAATARAGGHLLAPELHRLQGELLLVQGTEYARAALAAFRAAYHLAARQDSPSLQLRAALSLARLQRQTSVGDDGMRLLQKTVALFEPDLQYPDLQLARELIGGKDHAQKSFTSTQPTS